MYCLYLFKCGSDQKKELTFIPVIFMCPTPVGTQIQIGKSEIFLSFTKQLAVGSSSFVFTLFLIFAVF